MKTINIAQLRQLMALLGSRSTPAKRAAAQRNARKRWELKRIADKKNRSETLKRGV